MQKSMDQSVNFSFSKRDTQIAKGIAILCMLFHHTYPNVCHQSVFLLEDRSALSIIAAAGKICVALLTILSGYGLAQSYRKKAERGIAGDIRFVASHLIQLISIFWPINAVAAVLMFVQANSAFDFSNIQGVRGLVSGIIGIQRYAGDWYLYAIVIMYILFPVLYRLTGKFGAKFLLVSYLPWVLYFTQKYMSFNVKYDSFIFYIFAFSLGIYLALEDKLNKRDSNDLWVYLCFVLAFIARVLITLPIDVFLALSILLLLTRTKLFSGKAVQRVLGKIGKESANIWLLHPLVIAVLKRVMPSDGYASILFFVILSIVCVLASTILEIVKEKTRYKDLVSNLRRKIEGCGI